MEFKNKKQIYKHVIFSVSFVIITASIVGYLFQGSKIFSSFPFYIKYTGYGYSLFFTFWLGHLAIGYLTEKKLNWSKNMKKAHVISLSSYIIFGIIAAPGITYIFSVTVFEVKGNDLFWDVFIKSLMILVLDLLIISIYYSTNLTKYWKKAIENNEELKRENLIARYEVLKTQVKPHFLFNSLNTLSGVVEQKPELATDFIKKLSDIYRYVLEQSDKELVSMDEEMKFVEDYIFLSGIRFGDALVFNSNIPAGNSFHIVPMGMQILVENAIKHNIITDDLPLSIEIGIDDGYIYVRNNIQRKKSIISEKEPLGLENLKNRYEHLVGSSIHVYENDNEFTVKLPII